MKTAVKGSDYPQGWENKQPTVNWLIAYYEPTEFVFFEYLIYPSKVIVVDMIFCILHQGNKFREVGSLFQSHTAGEWQHPCVNPGLSKFHMTRQPYSPQFSKLTQQYAIYSPGRIPI